MNRESRGTGTFAIRNSLFAILVAALAIGLLLFLKGAFAGTITISPVALSLFGRNVHWYGILIALAILVGIPWFLKRAEARGVDRGRADTVAWWAVLGGIVGARLLYVVQNLDVFGASPFTVVAIQDGGLSIHGAILGGAVAAALACRILKVDFWKLADAAAPPILLGMIIGRFGNFTNHELFGPPTDVAWKMFVPFQDRPLGSQEEFYHPTFLYDAILNSLLLLYLLWSEFKMALSERSESNGPPSGSLFLAFIAGISLTRFLVEFWRLGETAALGLSSAQLVSLLLFLIAVTLLWLSRTGRLGNDTVHFRADTS